ncbi:MAG: alanine:cation symporter family protein [Oscillospiraceae bacterium]|nr:alanine:cation symporter family protein [Oscillospiraceae bacterium]
MFDTIVKVNSVINDFVWVKIGLFLLIGTGILTTVITKFFQIVHIKEWWMSTIGGIFKKESKVRENNDKGGVSQFQALCTALAATIGTGNIAGVSAAICMGGPGAVFWMWVAAFFGMMTSFSENVLGIYYRRRNKNGEWSGGAMYYLKDGLGNYKGCKKLGSVLAVVFAICAILASFGIGNMGQINKIVINLENAFFTNFGLDFGYAFGNVKWTSLIIGIILMIIGGLIILGGIQRIAAVAEKVVPFMAIAYIIGCLAVFFMHIDMVGDIFVSIFKFAFGVDAVIGGAVGISIKEVVTQGCKRGVFSNEAGLGSAVMVNASSNVKEPVKQGMWGILQVFIDTFVVCTMTAVVVLSSGSINLETGIVNKGVDDATLVANAFGNSFGIIGNIFIAVSILLFAFTTVLGWSHYGCKAFEYIFGEKATKFYRVFFVLMIVSGSLMTSSIAWDISDTFNGMMMIPNLIGVVSLSPMVIKITQNYVDRKIKKKDVEPVLSYDANIQAETAKAIKEEN